MYHAIRTDADGWVHEHIASEENNVDGTPVPLVHGGLLASFETFPFHWDGFQLTVPHDDRVMWRVLRRYRRTGHEASGMCRLFDEARTRLVATPGHVPLPAPGPRMHPLDNPTHDYTVDGVPGLALRDITHADLDVMADMAVTSGVYAAECPTDPPCHTPPQAHAWLSLAERIDTDTTWQMLLEFKGRPLQYELIYLDPTNPTVTLTFHFNRERPGWFWREAERPVWAAMRGRGYRHMWSRTRKDRPDWIETLKRNYNAIEIMELSALKVLEFPLDLGLFQGWPERRLTGAQFQTGATTVHEATDAEVPGLVEHVRGRWADPADGEMYAQRLEEHYYLDRATIVVAEEPSRPGKPDIRAIRWRGAPGGRHLAGVGQVTPGMRPESMQATKLWMVGAGYHDASVFMPQEFWDSPAYRGHATAVGWRLKAAHTRFRRPLAEAEMTLQ